MKVIIVLAILAVASATYAPPPPPVYFGPAPPGYFGPPPPPPGYFGPPPPPMNLPVFYPPQQLTLWKTFMNNIQTAFTTIKANLFEIFKLTAPAQPNPVWTTPAPKNISMDWTKYHGLDDIYDWLDDLAWKNRRIITPIVIGKSYEGRPIKAVRISAKPGNKAIFIESNIHAIEWISSATSTCFFDNLLKSQDKEMRKLLVHYDWIFVPVLNPDGFEYSHNVERLWRKNRKPTGFSNSSGICYGVDLNRNLDFHWGGAGYNIDVPCDHWYGGGSANSEPEVQALVKFVSSFRKGYIRMYLALHSYGNFVLLPYGHTNEEYPPNYNQMMRIATAFSTAAEVRYGTVFRSGASGVLSYPVSGATKDWAYGVRKIPFAATLELRDDGSKYGFFLPASQILEVCAEVTDGLIAMVRNATREGIFN